MAKQYRTGIIITGDAKGGVRAAQLTAKELESLNKTQTKGQKVQKKTRKETDDSSKSMGAYAGKLGLVTTAASALITVIAGFGIGGIVKDTVAANRETLAWANAVGVSAQELKAADFAAQSAGLSQGKIGDIYKDTAEKIADAYVNGGGEAVDALNNLNLSAADLVNLSPDKQLLAIAGGLDKVGSNAAKIQILESLASDASLLIPLLDNNAEKLKTLKAVAIDSGSALSDLDAAKLNLIDQEFLNLGASAEGFGNQLTVALAPAIFGVSKEINTMSKEWGGSGDIAQDAVDIAVSGLGFIFDAGAALRKGLKLVQIGWLEISKVGIDAFVGAGQAGVDLLNVVLQPIREVIGSIVEGYGYLIQAAADITGNESWKKAAAFALGYADAIKTDKFEMQDFIGLQKDIEDQLKQSNAELQVLINAGAPSDDLEKWVKRNRIEVERLAQANVTAADARKQQTLAQGKAVKQSKELVAAAAPIAQIYEDTASSIRSSFSGAFRDALDGQNSFKDRMVSLFKDMLAEMATLAIARPIIVPIVSGLGGLLGVPAAAQAGVISQLGGAGSAGGGLIGGAGTLFTGAKDFFTGGYAGIGGQQGAQLASQTADFGSAGLAATAGSADYLQSGGFFDTAGSVLGAGFVGYFAGGVAADIFDVGNPKMAQNLTAVGAAIAGPIGGVVGFAVGSLFSGSYQTKSAGVDLAFNAGDFSGKNFNYQEKKGGLFGGGGSRTVFTALGRDIEKGLTQSFDLITSDFKGMGDVLGANADQVLSQFNANVRISLRGLSSDEITKELDGFVKDVQNQLAEGLLPGFRDFQRAGESAAETLKRVTVTLQGINALDKTIEDNITLLNANNVALAQQSIAMRDADQVISDTLSAIADTSDVTDRVALEKQLSDQVLARYTLERSMLDTMIEAISKVNADINGLRFDIAGNIASITGQQNFRDLSAIRGDFNGLVPSSAPVLKSVDLSLINKQVVESLKSVSDAQNVQAGLNSQRDVLLSDSGFSDFIFRLEGSNETLISAVGRLQDVANTYNTIPEPKYLKSLEKLIGLNFSISSNARAVSDKQQTFDAFDAQKNVLQEEAAAALADYNEQFAEYISLTGNQVGQLKRLRDETLRYYNAQKLLDDAVRGSANSIAETLDQLRFSQLSPVQQNNDLLAEFRGLVASSDLLSGFDLAAVSDQINALVNPLLSSSSSLFASGAGYQDIFNEVTQSLNDLQSRLLSEAPVNFEQDSIDLLTSIDSLLGAAQTELSSADKAIVDAIELGRVDTVATLQDIRGLLGGDARTITDGAHATGLARVPFDGYTATLHQDEAVIDAGTMSGLRKYGVRVSAETGVSKLLPLLERIEKAVMRASGDLHLQVVTSDGKIIEENIFSGLLKRSKNKELVIHADGIG